MRVLAGLWPNFAGCAVDHRPMSWAALSRVPISIAALQNGPCARIPQRLRSSPDARLHRSSAPLEGGLLRHASANAPGDRERSTSMSPPLLSADTRRPLSSATLTNPVNRMRHLATYASEPPRSSESQIRLRAHGATAGERLPRPAQPYPRHRPKAAPAVR